MAPPWNGEGAALVLGAALSIDLDKFSDEIAGAILDVIEDERRINRSDISGVIKKITKGYIDKMQPSVGGYGAGVFCAPVGREFDWATGWPLLPDED